MKSTAYIAHIHGRKITTTPLDRSRETLVPAPGLRTASPPIATITICGRLSQGLTDALAKTHMMAKERLRPARLDVFLEAENMSKSLKNTVTSQS